jgi:hypothetical protein
MAYDKIIDSTSFDANLTLLANAIREKAGNSNKLTFPDGFSSAIESIVVGGGGEGIVADSLINITTAIDHNNTVAIYKCPELATMSWYLIYMYLVDIKDVSKDRTVAYFMCSDLTEPAMVYINSSGVTNMVSGYTDSHPKYAMEVDSTGNISVKGNWTLQPAIGTYRLIVLGGI